MVAASLISVGTGTVEFAGTECGPIEAGAGETVLYSGLRSGLPLPYGCASGGCGSCKASLLAGRVRSLWDAAPGLTDRDRRRGDRILMCQSVPVGRCVVQAPLGDRPEGPAPVRVPAVFRERHRLGADTALITVCTEQRLTWMPGQFVHLVLPDGVRRAYSMTRPPAPRAGQTLEFLVRAVPGGSASRWLFGGLAEGDRILVEGPYGKAHAQSPPDRPVVCLAGGTGLGPVLAIADRLQAESAGRELRVYVGARRREDVVLTDRLAVLRDRGASVVVVVEDATGPELAGKEVHRTGLALDHLLSDLPDLTGHDVYLAGPPAMVTAALRRLVRGGRAAADRVFVDKFL